MVKLCLISTKTSLSPFFKAIDNVNSELGSTIIDVKVFYQHLLDEKNLEYVKEFRNAITNSDVILIDIRSPTSWFVKELMELTSQSKAKVVIPLVVGSPLLLKLLKLGSLSGELIVSKLKDYDFDAQYLDMSRVWKIMDIFEKSGKVLPISILKHLRNWIFCQKYWMYWSENNLKNLLYLILKEYFNFNIKYSEPVIEIVPCSIYDPNYRFIKNVQEYLKLGKVDPIKPTIAILLYSGMHFDQCKPVAEYLFKMFNSLGFNVLLIVGGGGKDLDKNLDAVERNCMLDSKPIVDILINLQWFRINGGPYGGPSKPTWELLKKLNCLLINGLIMYMREVHKWEIDDRGLSPIEVITGVALPEIDGAIEPIPLAGLSDDYAKEIIIIKDRLSRRVERVKNWIKLRKLSNEDKRVAIIIYNYPPGEDNVGSASYLDVLKSLEVIIKYLKNHRYRTEEVSKERLKELIGKFLVNSPKWFEFNKHEVITLDLKDYLEYFNTLPNEIKEKIIKVWSYPPGNVNVVDNEFVIPGIVVGNVFIGVQPSRGVHENLDKIYHSKDLPPHHQYLAFYYWIEHIFKADVVIHLGTHGTLEFMPGKEVGLSSKCFPDILISNVPHVYIYHITNPSEMTIAKRRSYAYVITHGTPPFTKADLYEDYVELEELLHEYEEAKIQDPNRIEVIEKLVREKCDKLSLEFTSVEELHDKLFEMKRSIIPKGLHVIGQIWSDEDIIEYLTFIVRYDRDVKSLHRIIAEERGINYDEILEKPHTIVHGKRGGQIIEEIENEVRNMIENIIRSPEKIGNVIKRYSKKVRKDLEETLRYILDLYSRIKSSDELGSLLSVLNGEYIQPRVTGDPIRTPEIFPTGCHGYAFDPRLIPSKAAYLRGIKITEETLRMYREKFGKYPETVSVVLWGFETMGTRGETIGQILHYLGVRLVRKYGPWSWDLEPIPLNELGRPRIDVVVTICGIFRDTFPNLTILIDRAIKLVANLDEPPEWNYVRKHYLEHKIRFGEDSLIRIFGPKDGAYATRLTELIESSNWRSENELINTYIEDMMYGYGENIHSKPLKELFKELLSKVDLVTQIRYAHEYEITDLDHYYEFLGGLKKTVENIKGSKVETFWIDTTTEKIKYRSVKDAIDYAVRTRLLNPKWINAMLNHGYDGVREVSKRIEYILGLTATTGEVPNWVWSQIAEKYIFNEELRNKMLRENKWATYEIIRRLYEVYVRGYWKAESKVIDKLKEIASRIEEMLEE